MNPSSKVLLVSPPWRTPDESNLALGTLRPILEREGLEVDELHCTHLFPPSDSFPIVLLQYSTFFFIPHLYPEVSHDEVVEAMLEHVLDEVNLQGSLVSPEDARFEDHDLDEDKLRSDAHRDIELAGVCLERSFERMVNQGYDIIGFSCTFETQIPAALYLARRIKQVSPDVKIMFGGAACFGEPAEELVRIYPFIDAICHCEGDQVITPLVRALRDDTDLALIPGIVWRDGDGEVRLNDSPPLLRDLDWLPMPEYGDFLKQHYDSAYRSYEPKIYFETSRGCWWGEKHLCTFCGLNAEGIAFRKKSAERAYDEIYHLYSTHSGRLHATDNILDMRYFETVLPRLATMKRNPFNPLRIFFETKSNLRLHQVEALANAGVDLVQPGIEAFSDGILKVMRKGATGLTQVQIVKWLNQHRINIAYNLLIRNPGETAQDYRDMIPIIDAIEHLQPPHINAMWLERFSPYYNHPEQHGIRNVRPKDYYRFLYREPGVDLSRLAYVFDYDYAGFEDPELIAAHRAYAARVVKWQVEWQADQAFWRLLPTGQIAIVDRRKGKELTTLLGGLAADLFRFLDGVHNRSAIRRNFPDADPELIDCLLETWLHRQWIVRDGRARHISVLPRQFPKKAAAARTAPAPQASL